MYYLFRRIKNKRSKNKRIYIMKYSNYIYTLIVSLVIGFFYNRYKRFEDVGEEKASYAMVQKYLINMTPNDANDNDNEDVAKKQFKKPILWIHMKYDVNARWWSSFYSRNSTDLNQPYLYLTIKSIIDTCGQDFHICLIDDESFGKLMPDWIVDVSLLADPVKTKVREIALAKLLYRYGGLRVPPAFICFQSLLPLYNYNMAFHVCLRTVEQNGLRERNVVFSQYDFSGVCQRRTPHVGIC